MCPFSVRARGDYARSFSRDRARLTSVLASAFRPHHASAFLHAGFPWHAALSLAPALPSAGSACPIRHSFAHSRGTGISACLPSDTPFGLSLGPDSPRADEPSSGDLGPSVCGILTRISLLTPAFSLPCAPRILPDPLRRSWNAPLPYSRIHSFGVMLSPGKLSARSHSTSELLRTLSRMAASEPTS